MGHNHVTLGIFLLLLGLAFFGTKYLRAPKQAHFPVWGWMGLGIITLAGLLLFRRVPWVSVFFTPIAWTGYILFIDALVWRLTGQSRLGGAPRSFFALAFWSFPLWLLFEAYNLRLRNWDYVGLPENLILQGVGYVWSFATIWPAIFETADFIQGLGIGQGVGKRRIAFSQRAHFAAVVIGFLLVSVPVLVPARIGSHLFGAVWLGFIFLLDPINYRWGGHSLLRDWESGRAATFLGFMLAGLVCGILWEFWNYWASAKWVYTFAIAQDLKIFEMPLPGYLGFPAFALECLVMYEFLRSGRKRLLERRCRPALEAARSGT